MNCNKINIESYLKVEISEVDTVDTLLQYCLGPDQENLSLYPDYRYNLNQYNFLWFGTGWKLEYRFGNRSFTVTLNQKEGMGRDLFITGYFKITHATM